MSTSAIDDSEFLREQRRERDRARMEAMLLDQERRARAFLERCEAAKRERETERQREFCI